MKFNPNSSVCPRIYSHLCLGLATKVNIKQDSAADYEHKANLIEKTGNGILWLVGSIPRSIKQIKRQFQDPRIVTLAIAALACFTATFCFYPITTISAIKTTKITFTLLTPIPFWSVKLAGYLITCSTILGCGLRAGGRFANSSLMKAFYDLPQSFKGNPSSLTIAEIRAAKQKKPS